MVDEIINLRVDNDIHLPEEEDVKEEEGHDEDDEEE